MNQTMFTYGVLPLIGYLIGAIPFGFMISRAKGIDIRTQGSGNIGSTNVGRVLGQPWGYICFLLDVAKGLLPVLYAGHYLNQTYLTEGVTVLPPSAQGAWLIVAASCIIGHMFSIYLGFKGGKGVATSLGVVLGVWPYFTFTGVVVFMLWIAVWGMWRYVSLASIVAAISFPIIFVLLTSRIEAWVFNELTALFAFSCVLAFLVVIKHHSNIKRLLAGTENRGGKPKN